MLKYLCITKEMTKHVAKNYVKYKKEQRVKFLAELIKKLLKQSKKSPITYQNMEELWLNCLEKERKEAFKEMGEDLEKYIEEIQIKDLGGKIKKFKKTNLVIGKGGSSNLFLGVELSESGNQIKFLAIKYFNVEFIDRGLNEGFFLSEKHNKKITNLICHGYLINKNPSYKINEEQYIQVIEFIDGFDLEYYIKKESFLTESKAKEIFYKIVKILNNLDISHRDLKPSNM